MNILLFCWLNRIITIVGTCCFMQNIWNMYYNVGRCPTWWPPCRTFVTHAWPPVWPHDDTAMAEHSLNCRAVCGNTQGSHCWQVQFAECGLITMPEWQAIIFYVCHLYKQLDGLVIYKYSVTTSTQASSTSTSTSTRLSSASTNTRPSSTRPSSTIPSSTRPSSTRPSSTSIQVLQICTLVQLKYKCQVLHLCYFGF